MRSLLHSLAVKLDGLGPLLAGKGLIGLLLHTFQVWGQLHLGAKERRAGQTSSRLAALPKGICMVLWSLGSH